MSDPFLVCFLLEVLKYAATKNTFDPSKLEYSKYPVWDFEWRILTILHGKRTTEPLEGVVFAWVSANRKTVLWPTGGVPKTTAERC
jgi:hypothetical protein